MGENDAKKIYCKWSLGKCMERKKKPSMAPGTKTKGCKMNGMHAIASCFLHNQCHSSNPFDTSTNYCSTNQVGGVGEG